MDKGWLADLVTVFAPMSLSAFGGGISILAAMQHQSVVVHQWVTAEQFVAFFALSRAAPGPGLMIVPLIGYQVAGWPGALISLIAMIAPSSALAVGVVSGLTAHRHRPWVVAMASAIVPVGTGMIIAGMIGLVSIADLSYLAMAIGVASAVVCIFLPKIHPVAVIAAAAATNVIVPQLAGLL